jgi:predicted AAA+ superfamily ATPase
METRKTYLAKISEFIDKPFIKVITGLRRSGKSSLLFMLKESILNRGVDQEQIIYLNFESFENSDIMEAKLLYQYVKSKISNTNKYYVLLDEIQEVKEWEKAVNSFLVDFNIDIYITGSNSHLLSSELATLIAGRYVEFQIQTLSFQEYLQFNNAYKIQEQNNTDAFTYYLRMGGFPVIHTGNYSFETAYKVVYDIYSSAVLRDTIQRHQIRDIELLERVIKYVFDNVGNSFSGKNIADYFKSQQRKIDINTVYNYLNALESAFIIYKIPRYDIKGKEILKTQEKYFVGDPSLIYAVMGYKDRLIGGILENIIMLELKRRDYKVYIGKLGTKEIDFIAEKGNAKVYIQVAYLLPEQSTIDREFSPLLEIKDNYPKYVVTMDPLWTDNIEGIKHVNIVDFLLMEEF